MGIRRRRAGVIKLLDTDSLDVTRINEYNPRILESRVVEVSAQSERAVYESGEWELDLHRRELRARGVPVPIGSRAFEMVEVLVQAGGNLVTKDDLMGRVWPGAIVEENTLQVHISGIRKALGPDREMLKTASRRGYRLLGNWTVRPVIAPANSIELAPSPLPSELFLSNLPEAVSDLIGRAASVQNLRALLSAYRMVTLTGSGGIGKTRLALEVARSELPSFQGDAWLVELASLSDPSLVPSAVAGALGLQLGADEITPAAVVRAIGKRKLLLVLDNCEHVIDAAAGLAEAVLRMCPGASIVATSREALRIDGEHAYSVPPLDVPTEYPQRPENVLAQSAVQLFIARTKAQNFDFSPHEEDHAAIAAICRCLDGIPLAIELAAAHAATLGLERALSHLDGLFELLTVGRRTVLPRHKTLRATFDWSYDLLPETERRLLRCLAVFVGGFTLEAAAAVAGETHTPTAIVEKGIAGLVAKSLVVLDGSGTAGRCRLLQATRAYAAEKLTESGEAAQAARHHAEFFRDMFSPPTPGLGIWLSKERLAVYGQEIHNVRTALDWAFSPAGDIAIGGALTAEYVPVWLRLSLVAECRERVQRAWDSLGGESAQNSRLMMQLRAAGIVLVETVELPENAGSSLANVLELAESLDDLDSQLRALWAMWTYRINNGEPWATQPIAERFLQLAGRRSDPADVLVGDRLIGNAMHYAGNQPEARRYLERVLDLYVAPSDQRHATWFFFDQRLLARSVLARVLLLQGFVDQAKHTAQVSLVDAQAKGDKMTLCLTLGEVVCPIALMTGDLDAAERSVAMLVDLAATHSLTLWASFGQCLEGALLIKRGKVTEGSILLRAAVDAFPAAGQTVHLLGFLGDLAEGLAAVGRLTEAHATLDEALARYDRDERLWCVAELLRVKGELLLLETGGQSVSAAESCFFRALDISRRQGAQFWQLRAALGLARLRVRQDRQDDARQFLAPVYDQFTEGFETADLRNARALLETLSICRTELDR
jgi:predicted ATPase/DNA-binding winged helix-turn-helix (wHTH) protein